MTESRDYIREKLINKEGQCDCMHGHLHNPKRGWMCDLTTWTGETDFSKGKTCREMCGTEECKKHAYREIRTVRYKADPIFTEFEDDIADYVEVSR